MNTQRTLSILAILLAMMVSAPTLFAQDAPPPEGGDEAPAEAEADKAPVEEEPPPMEETPEGGDDADAEVSEEMEPEGSGTVHERGGLFGAGLVISLKAGGGFNQILSPLGATFVGELELAYLFPFHDRNLGIFVSGQFSMPGSAETITEPDPRLPPDNTWSYDISTLQAIITYGLIYRIPIPSDLVRPYIAAGGRTYLMETTSTGKSADGEDFGTNVETGIVWGGYGALGADFFLGPGALLFEVQFGYAPIDKTILQNSNAGSLNVALGYRIFL